jgi:Yip1 domain
MSEPASTPVPMSLFARAVGVITSPKATFENVVALPRPFGILFVTALIIGFASVAPQFTDAGRQATLDMQVRTIERFGQTVTPEMYAAMEARTRNTAMTLLGATGGLITLPIIAMLFAALYWVAFNTVMGGTASFKQVLAIVSHSQVISALGIVAGLPIQLMQTKMTMGGPFNLGALAPMLEEGSTLATFLGGISVFSLWGLVVTAIGLGVLYRRNSRNIAITLIAVFLLLAYAVSALFGSLFGGA